MSYLDADSHFDADHLVKCDASDELTRDILSWDTRTWARAAAFWEDKLGPVDQQLLCLEVGAGPGGPTLMLALKGHRVICSNWAETQAQAAPLHDRYGVTAQVEYQDIDVVDIPYTDHFDVIVFKSVLGGLAEHGKSSRMAMEEIHRALKPGGRLIFAENMRGTVVHRWARALAYRVCRASWRFAPEREVRSLLSPFSHYELHTTGVLALFGVTERQRRGLAAADSAFFDRLVPSSWRYVAYGIATK
jgi:SAM-dependent methyltransferase